MDGLPVGLFPPCPGSTPSGGGGVLLPIPPTHPIIEVRGWGRSYHFLNTRITRLFFFLSRVVRRVELTAVESRDLDGIVG